MWIIPGQDIHGLVYTRIYALKAAVHSSKLFYRFCHSAMQSYILFSDARLQEALPSHWHEYFLYLLRMATVY